MRSKVFFPKSAECHANCGKKNPDGTCKAYKSGKKIIIGENGLCAGYKTPDGKLGKSGRAEY